MSTVHLMQGNEACAAGAIDAGCRFFAGYPITPATEIAEIMAERLNLAEAPLLIAVPTQGLSIPNVPDGPFWNPPADAAFLEALQEDIREDIPVLTYERHVNDPQFGREVAKLFIDLVEEND